MQRQSVHMNGEALHLSSRGPLGERLSPERKRLGLCVSSSVSVWVSRMLAARLWVENPAGGPRSWSPFPIGLPHWGRGRAAGEWGFMDTSRTLVTQD